MDPVQNDQTETRLEQVVLTQVIRMDATINGVVAGLFIGLLIMLATLWLVIKGGPVVGPHLGLLDQFFYGYSVTFLGSLVGFAYGFIIGFVAGYFVGFTYNRVVDVREHLRHLRVPGTLANAGAQAAPGFANSSAASVTGAANSNAGEQSNPSQKSR